MKRNWTLLALLTALVLSLLTGCGKSSTNESMSVDRSAMEVEAFADYEVPAAYPAAYNADTKVVPAPKSDDAKIIYTADMSLEATDFDAAVDALARLTEESGGYYESSSLSNGGSYRSASYTVRVPAENYRSFLTQAGELCHLLNVYEYADDVSEAYYDTDGRLQTQQTKLERLRDLLAQAKDMEDIITLESAISDTELAIEQLTGSLRKYDSLVGYATVHIYLQEVYQLTEQEQPVIGFGAKLAAAFRTGCSRFVYGLQDLLISLARAWVGWLIFLAVLAVVVLVVWRIIRKKKITRAQREDGETQDEREQ